MLYLVSSPFLSHEHSHNWSYHSDDVDPGQILMQELIPRLRISCPVIYELQQIKEDNEHINNDFVLRILYVFFGQEHEDREYIV